MEKEFKYLVGEFQITGNNQINVDLVCKDWNHLWVILQHNDTYRLVKYVRKDSQNTALKTDISNIQALEIIKKLKLTGSETFLRSYTSWRLPAKN
jgi:hypothetical protein